MYIYIFVFSALRIAARAAEAGLENFPLHGCVKRLNCKKKATYATYAALTAFASAALAYVIQRVALKCKFNTRAPRGCEKWKPFLERVRGGVQCEGVQRGEA